MTEDNKEEGTISAEQADKKITAKAANENPSPPADSKMPNKAFKLFIVTILAIGALAYHNGEFKKLDYESKISSTAVTESAVVPQTNEAEEAALGEVNEQTTQDLLTPHITKKARIHILYGDETGGAHHYATTQPCKSVFPKSWNADRIIQVTEAIAANDTLDWQAQKNGRMFAQVMEDGVLVRVVMDETRSQVITAYPLNGQRTPCPAKSSAANDNSEGDEEDIKNSSPSSALGGLLDDVKIEYKHKYNE